MRSEVNNLKVRVYKSKTFKNWYGSKSVSEKRIVDSRIDTFKKEGVLIKVKSLSIELSLYEFKWDSGMRIYFSLLRDGVGNFMLLLVGGNKNTQNADINRSKTLIVQAVKGIKKKEKSRSRK